MYVVVWCQFGRLQHVTVFSSELEKEYYLLPYIDAIQNLNVGQRIELEGLYLVVRTM